MTAENALVLIVEDEPDIADILVRYMEREGLRAAVARNGDDAIARHQQLRPDLVLLDVKLPRRDGFEVLAEIRRRAQTPVIMLTAMAEDLDKLSALRMGADDYVVKPFNPLEVVARIKAVLRRSLSNYASNAPLRVGNLEIDTGGMTVTVVSGDDRKHVALTAGEFRILALLAASPRRVFSRADIIEASFEDSHALHRVVDSHVSRIRNKLADAKCSDTIVSVRGAGYRFEVRLEVRA
jgi:two-component system, OmpR family, response regulator AdeR